MGQYTSLGDEDLAFQLYCAAQDGAEDARNDILQEIAQRYGRTVFATLSQGFQGALSQEDIDEVLWSSLTELGESIDKYPMDSVKLSTWWATIAHNDALDLIRHNNALKRGGGKKVLSIDEPVGDEQQIELPARDETGEGTDLKELASAIEEELKKFSPLEQDVVRTLIALAEAGEEVDREVDQRIADRHGTTAKNVKFVRHQIRETLWEALKKRGFDLPALRRRT